MGKIETVKSIFEIGKIAADTYRTYTDAQRTIKEMADEAKEKEKEIEKLKEENENLKKQLKEKEKEKK